MRARAAAYGALLDASQVSGTSRKWAHRTRGSRIACVAWLVPPSRLCADTWVQIPYPRFTYITTVVVCDLHTATAELMSLFCRRCPLTCDHNSSAIVATIHHLRARDTTVTLHDSRAARGSNPRTLNLKHLHDQPCHGGSFLCSRARCTAALRAVKRRQSGTRRHKSDISKCHGVSAG